jgi:hypothetical protein
MSTSVVTILRALHGATSIHAIEGFTSYFRRSPDQLWPDPVREYQVHVFHDRKLSPHSIEGQAAALQLLFLETLYCDASLPIRERATHLSVDPLKVSGTQMDHPATD